MLERNCGERKTHSFFFFTSALLITKRIEIEMGFLKKLLQRGAITATQNVKKIGGAYRRVALPKNYLFEESPLKTSFFSNAFNGKRKHTPELHSSESHFDPDFVPEKVEPQEMYKPNAQFADYTMPNVDKEDYTEPSLWEDWIMRSSTRYTANGEQTIEAYRKKMRLQKWEENREFVLGMATIIALFVVVLLIAWWWIRRSIRIRQMHH